MIRICSVSALLLCLAPLSLSAADEKAEKITYQDHIQPIFRQHCGSCHNTNKKIADLDLLNYTAMMQGGGSGPVIEPGDAANSYLFMLVNHDSEPTMPPNQDKIAAAKIDLLRKWIDGGVLENSGSKAMIKKPKFDLSLSASPSGRPEGPPPMPELLSLDPVVHTDSTTAITALATSPWSPLVAVAGQKQVLLYNTKTLELSGVLPFPEGVPQSLKFSRNGALLLAGGGHDAQLGKVVVWNVRTGERVIEVGDELDTVLAADISSDQTLVALGGPGKVVRVYSTQTGELKYELTKHTDWIYSVAFSPDGVLLTTGDRNGGLLMWEAQTGREYLGLDGHKGAITDISWRSDSNIVASASEDGSVKLWEVRDGKNVKSWTAHGGGAASVEFARDGRLVTCGRDKTTKLWDQNGQQLRAFPAFNDIALRVTICDETNQVIAGDWTGAIKVWAAADGKAIGDLTANPLLLEDRLAQAKNQLTGTQAEHKKMADGYAAAQAALKKVEADLAAAQKAAAESEAKTKALPGEIAKAKAAVEALGKEVQAATATVNTLNGVVPPLNEALTKAKQAAEKAKDDKALAEALTKLQAQVTQKQADLDAAKKAQAEKTALMQQKQKEQAAYEKQLADANTALEAAKKQVAALTPNVKPAQDKANQAKAAADAMAAQLATAQKEIARLETEIQISSKKKALTALKTKADELSVASQQAAAELKQSQDALTAANQTVATTQKQVETATANITTAQKQLTDATAAQTAANKEVTTLGTLVPALQSTLKNAEEAAAKSPGDKDVAGAVAAWKTLVSAKTQALETAKKTLTEKTAAVETTKKAVATAEQALTKAKTDLAAAQKQVADLMAAVKPLEAKAQAAQKEAASASAAVDAAQKELEELKKSAGPQPQVVQAKAG